MDITVYREYLECMD